MTIFWIYVTKYGILLKLILPVYFYFLMWFLEKLKLHLEEACIIFLSGSTGPYAWLLLKSEALWQGLQSGNTSVSYKYFVWPGQCSNSLLFRCL